MRDRPHQDGVLRGLHWGHAVVPAGIIGAAGVAIALMVGPAPVWEAMRGTVFLASLMLLGVLPMALIALWRHDWRGGAALAIVASLFVVHFVGLTLPRVGLFADLEWNWQGKTLDLIWCLALIALLAPDQRREIGWTWRTRAGTLPVAFINIGILVAVGYFALGAGAPGDLTGGGLTRERVLYDTTYPNLVEEIVFRGLMLALLDRAFAPRWSFSGASIGWGLILTSWLFGLGHGIYWGEGGELVFDPLFVLMTFAAGLVFGWIRALTGSLWPAFLAHCAPEMGILLALWLR